MNRWLIPALSLFAVTLCPAQAVKGDIQPVIEGMRSEISARPSRVLIAVEDALTMNEQAACEIVQEAIVSTRADAKLVGEIVYTALKHAPGMAATIVECALRTGSWNKRRLMHEGRHVRVYLHFAPVRANTSGITS